MNHVRSEGGPVTLRSAAKGEADVINALRDAKLAYQRAGPRLLHEAIRMARDYGMRHEQIATELNMTRYEVAAIVPESSDCT